MEVNGARIVELPPRFGDIVVRDRSGIYPVAEACPYDGGNQPLEPYIGLCVQVIDAVPYNRVTYCVLVAANVVDLSGDAVSSLSSVVKGD